MKDKKLRSSEWFGRTGKDGFIYRSWMKNQGIPAHEFKGKPVIGICNTWSELTPCNAHFRELAVVELLPRRVEILRMLFPRRIVCIPRERRVT